MATLTLVYAADKSGNFINPDTGKPWEQDSCIAFFSRVIGPYPVICDIKSFVAHSTSGHVKDNIIAIINRQKKGREPDCLEDTVIRTSPLGALSYMRYTYTDDSEFFGTGTKETIEALAPFASRVLALDVNTDETGTNTRPRTEGFPVWMPGHLVSGIESWYKSGLMLIPIPEKPNTFFEYHDIHRQMPIEL